MPRGANDESEEVARRLMREGFGDEEIERRTGLSMLRLLAIRAGAAVEDRAPPPRRPPRLEPSGSDPDA